MSKARININGRELTGHTDQTILEIATENGIGIPTLCFSGDMEVYASCGLCLVEVEGAPRLLRGCATKIADGMVVQTENEKIKKARKLALELILSDHAGDCRAPCVLACPANCDAQGYAALVANGQYKEALKLVKDFMPIPACIGRVCPAPCEDNCRRTLVEGPVSIRYFKRLIADLDLASDDPYRPEVEPDTGKKIAVVGSGPAGLTAAYFLRRNGNGVTILESLPEMGGMLRYGIPEYRLPKTVLDAEIQLILDLGVEAKTGVQLGEDFSIDYLFKNGFDAVYLAIGAQNSRRMGVPGEDVPGILGGTEFLRAVMLNEEVSLGEKVAVIGGGNTAMDAARTAKRLGSKVTVVYRRAREQMPAQAIEVDEAEEEGVELYLLANPVKIEGDGKVEKMVCQKMQLGEPDASGRRRPEPIPDEYFTLEVDTIIAAIGQDVGIEKIKDDVDIDKWNTIHIEEDTFVTNVPGVFAGGDAVTGPGIAIEAIAAGKRVTEVIENYLGGKMAPYKTYYDIKQEDLTEEDFADREKQDKVEMPITAPEVRVQNFREAEQGISPEGALKDGQRCLECGCFDSFECKLRDYATTYQARPERIGGEKHDYETEVHPFILRDQNKCILCGLCVRVCSEVIGAEALGFVNRGFNAYVSPSLDLPLEETSCIACGQCVSNCPTGALVENMPFDKPAPWQFKETVSVCGYCGVGCSIQVETIGNQIARMVPYGGPVNESTLCSKGRFGFDFVNSENRLKTPLIKENGQLKETTWKDALLYISKKAKSLKARFGGESMAVFAGPRYSNEESYLIQKFARGVLGSNNINSFGEMGNPLAEVLGWGASTNSYQEIGVADFVLGIGVDFNDYPIVALKMKLAAEQGGKMWLVDSRTSKLGSYAEKIFQVNETADTNVFVAMLVYALQNGFYDKGFTGTFAANFGELKEKLENKNIGELISGSGLKEDDIATLVEGYAAAKKPLLVLGSSNLSPEAIQVLAGLAILLGKVGKPRQGILNLRGRCNSQGISDAGVSPAYLSGYQKVTDENSREKFARKWKVPMPPKEGLNTAGVMENLESGKIKGLFVFGEEPDEKTAQKLGQAELLVVQDLFLTDLAKQADVVLPAASFAETEGSLTNSERRIQRLRPAIEPLTGKQNWEILLELMEMTGYQQDHSSPEEVWNEMRELSPIFEGLNYQDLNNAPYWAGSPVGMVDKMVAANGKFNFVLPKNGIPAFQEAESVDSMLKWYKEFMTERGLQKLV